MRRWRVSWRSSTSWQRVGGWRYETEAQSTRRRTEVRQARPASRSPAGRRLFPPPQPRERTRTGVRRLLRHTDLLAAVAVVMVVTMLVVPLPPMLLDLLIT